MLDFIDDGVPLLLDHLIGGSSSDLLVKGVVKAGLHGRNFYYPSELTVGGKGFH